MVSRVRARDGGGSAGAHPTLRREEVHFLPVASEESTETVGAFASTQGYDFPIGVDPDGSIYGLYATRYVPRNILIAPDGTVVASRAGYSPETFAELTALIEQLLR